ncbi:unnamed protein product [Camellia sinensis]
MRWKNDSIEAISELHRSSRSNRFRSSVEDSEISIEDSDIRSSIEAVSKLHRSSRSNRFRSSIEAPDLNSDPSITRISSNMHISTQFFLSKPLDSGNSQRPEVCVVTWNNDELATDALPVHGFEHYKAKDYALAHAPFSGSSYAGGQWAAGDEPLYYIVSPKDVVIAKPRDAEDHISWLLQHGWHEKALAAVEAGQGRSELLDESRIENGKKWVYVVESGIADYEVVALMAIKNALNDRYNVLENWDINSVDPCYWRMFTCSADGLPSQSLTGTLSPSIANLSNLQSVLLQNNAISGPIPAAIGKLEKLQTLDLSSNKFNGEIPSSLGDLKNLNYLKLNNNSLTGSIPDTLSKVEGLTLRPFVQQLQQFRAKNCCMNFQIIGNPLICGPNSDNNCSVVYPEPVSFPPDGVKDGSESGTKSHRVAVTFGVSFGAAFLIIVIIGSFVWWRYRHNQQIFFDVNG